MGLLAAIKKYREETRARELVAKAQRAARAQAERDARERQLAAEHEARDRQIAVQREASLTGARAWALGLPVAIHSVLATTDEDTLLSLHADWQRLGLAHGGRLLPRKGETILGYTPNVPRMTWHNQRLRTGGYRGTSVSVRVARGVWVHPHFSAPATDESVRNLRQSDLGELYLTDARIYYAGGEHNVDLPFAKMETMPQWTQDGFVIVANGTKDDVFVIGDAPRAQSWRQIATLVQLVARHEHPAG